MPNYNHEESPVIKEEAQFSITVSIDPLQKLKELTEYEINRLNSERRSIESVHSNLDLLIKRYNLEKSYFGQISNWYGSKAWWVKILLFILVAAVGAGIGLLCHMPITFVLISSAVYIFFAFFFINHHKINEKQTKRLCEDIIELEKSLAETVKHFNELSNSLKTILINSHELNSQMLNDMQSLQENVNMLTNQVTKYKQIILELEKSKESIIQTTAKVQQNLINGDKKYQECCATILNQASHIDSLCEDLSLRNTSLKLDSEAMQNVIIKYQETTQRIFKAANEMEVLLTNLKNNKPLSKLVAKNEMQGDSERRTVVCSSVNDDSSTVPTKQDASSVEFSKKSNKNSYISILQAKPITHPSQNDVFFNDKHTNNDSIDDKNYHLNNEKNKQILEEAKQTRLKTQILLKKINKSRDVAPQF